MSKRYEISEDDETADLADINVDDTENNVFETIDNDENKIGEQVSNSTPEEEEITVKPEQEPE